MSNTPLNGVPYTQPTSSDPDDATTERVRARNAEAIQNATNLTAEEKERLSRAAILDPNTGLLDPEVLPAQEGGELTTDLVNKINQVPGKANQTALTAEIARATNAEEAAVADATIKANAAQAAAISAAATDASTKAASAQAAAISAAATDASTKANAAQAAATSAASTDASSKANAAQAAAVATASSDASSKANAAVALAATDASTKAGTKVDKATGSSPFKFFEGAVADAPNDTWVVDPTTEGGTPVDVVGGFASYNSTSGYVSGAPTTAVRTPLQRFSDEVVLDDFYVAADGTNWSLTLTRALTYATSQNKAVRLKRLYSISTVTPLPSGSTIVGNGRRTGLVAPTDAPVQLFSSASGATDISLENFLIDGGVTTSLTTKNYVRGARFQDTQRIRLKDMHVKNCADWALSFERCSDVSVLNHVHSGGGLGLPGGRDGVHFLDSSNVVVDGARIYSGDDCVAFTTETVGNSNIIVRNITGRSDIGSVVVGNEEGSTTFPMSNISISGVRTDGTARDVVRIYTLNSGTQLSGIKISDVKGTSTNHGVYVGGKSGYPALDVAITDVDVTSSTQHGVYLTWLDGFSFTGAGKSTTGSFDGINLANCVNGSVRPSSRQSSLWGMQLNTCTNVEVLAPNLLECGGNNFGSNTGGGLRISGCTTIAVTGGALIGSPTTTYRGISVGSSTGVTVTSWTRLAGAAASGGTFTTVGTATSGPYLSTTDPLVTSDTANGFVAGQQWINTATNVLYVCLSASTGAAVWQRSTADIQTFLTSGTWTKPAWSKTVTVVAIGNGAGGGSGAQQASGTAASGGAGGGGGGYAIRDIPASLLGSSESVSISTSIGAAGAAQNTASTAGNAGGAGGASSFGAHVRASGGAGGGAGGLNAASSAGSAGTGVAAGGAGGGGANGGVGANGNGGGGGAGGGAGGGISSGGTTFAGGSGAQSNSSGASLGASGTTGGGAGGTGGSSVTNEPSPGASGGGGGSNTSGAGGVGGAGGSYGGGGGGGGASINGSSSGAGGAGAAGIVVVISQ